MGWVHFIKGNPWYDKEELRTISGYIEADAYVSTDTYDPICNNCYCLHNVPNKARYYPRIGHSGFKKGKHEIPGKGLEDFCTNPTFNLAWPSRYMIA
jgi:hypothetical protein